MQQHQSSSLQLLLGLLGRARIENNKQCMAEVLSVLVYAAPQFPREVFEVGGG